MLPLKWIPESIMIPRGKPRVYLCCHPGDYDRYFEPITEEILRAMDCVIMYADPHEEASHYCSHGRDKKRNQKKKK